MSLNEILITLKFNLQKFTLSCQYMEFDIISDSKIISQRLSHSLSGLEPMFNNFISLNLFFYGNSGLAGYKSENRFETHHFITSIVL
jgi:hypothetical protein